MNRRSVLNDVSYSKEAIIYFNELAKEFSVIDGRFVNYVTSLLSFHNTYFTIQYRYGQLVWLYKDILKHFPYDKVSLYCIHRLIDLLNQTGEVYSTVDLPELVIDPDDKGSRLQIENIEYKRMNCF